MKSFSVYKRKQFRFPCLYTRECKRCEPHENKNESCAKNLPIPRRICTTYGFLSRNKRRKDSGKRSRRTCVVSTEALAHFFPSVGDALHPSYADGGNTGVVLPTPCRNTSNLSVSHRPTTRSDACRTENPTKHVDRVTRDPARVDGRMIRHSA